MSYLCSQEPGLCGGCAESLWAGQSGESKYVTDLSNASVHDSSSREKKVCLRLVLRRAALLDTRYAECWLSEQERLDVIDQATEFEILNIYFS
jgi:phenylalanine-4-hydroxylase